MGVPERIEAAKRRDRMTDEDVGRVLGVKGATAQRYRTGRIVLPRERYVVAAAWFGDVDAETVRLEAESQADTGGTSSGPGTLQEAADAMASAGDQMVRALREAQRLAARLDRIVRRAEQQS